MSSSNVPGLDLIDREVGGLEKVFQKFKDTETRFVCWSILCGNYLFTEHIHCHLLNWQLGYSFVNYQQFSNRTFLLF